jgi:nucleoside-diphosphate-sugar epimerase
MSTVLVTGGSGFIGGECIRQLLAGGHTVRATLRDRRREPEVRARFAQPAALTFFAADLESDTGWAEAAAGCDFVLHVASPFPAAMPKDDQDLIRPARDGTLRVLRAARDAGAKRVVLTSSFAAIGYGHPPQSVPFDETSWTDPNAPGLSAYVKSKTIAERAAWDFVAREGGGLELSAVNPVAVLGPVAAPDYSPSIEIVERFLNGSMPGFPRLCFGLVDVRDVADLHLRTMTSPAARGERFLAVAGRFLWMIEMATVLKARLGERAAKVPNRQLPNWLLRMAALFVPAVRQILPELGKEKNATSRKAQSLLGWTPRPPEEALLATAESLPALPTRSGKTR